MIKLLHEEKFLPEFIIKKVLYIERHLNVDRMTLTQHLTEHINNVDMKHEYTENDIRDCLKWLIKNPTKPFEVEYNTATQKITKWVVRIPFDDYRDMSISIRGYRIITAWVNDLNDNHRTLDLSKYDDSI